MKPLNMSQILGMIISVLIFTAAAAAAGQRDASTMSWNIRTQSLKSALEIYQQVSGLNLAYSDSLVKGKTTRGVQGNHTRKQALEKVLKGTDLTCVLTSKGTVILKVKNFGAAQEKNSLSYEIAGNKAEKSELQQERMKTDLGNMTVSAQKTEENIQEVPISMTVFDEYDIQDMQIDSIKDIAKYTPNLLLFNKNSNGSLMPTIRGINTSYGSTESAVGLFVDGVPMIGSSGLDAPIADVERIEVLKGPQGTLYGQGTESGVINIITKKPNNETKGKIAAKLGSDNLQEYTASVSGPIIQDTFYVRLSARHYEKDGYVYNAYLNENADDIKNDYGKITFRYNPTDNLDISLISSKVKYDNTGSPTGMANQKKRIKYTNDEYTKTETELHALKVEYDFDKYKFESITTKKEQKDIWLMDYDFTPNFTSHAQNDSVNETISQELRLSSSTDKLNWLIGFNYYDDDIDGKFKTLYGVDSFSVAREFYGFFTHLDYQLINQLSLIAGFRYDKHELNGKRAADNLDISYDEISPKVGLEYDFNNGSMVYTTVAKGYRPAGFYIWALDGYPKEFDKETIWSYEIGSKNSFLENRLTMNAALYYMKVDDMQVHLSITKYSSYKDNAAKATSKGFEFDINYKSTDNLEFFASFGYNDTKFDEFKDKKGDYSGNYNVYAPKYNYNIGTQYRADQGYYARVDINGYGKMYLDVKNENSRDAYNLVSTKIGYEQEDHDIYLYANNLFDKEYDKVGGGRTYSPPREIGVQLTYRF